MAILSLGSILACGAWAYGRLTAGKRVHLLRLPTWWAIETIQRSAQFLWVARLQTRALCITRVARIFWRHIRPHRLHHPLHGSHTLYCRRQCPQRHHLRLYSCSHHRHRCTYLPHHLCHSHQRQSLMKAKRAIQTAAGQVSAPDTAGWQARAAATTTNGAILVSSRAD